MLRLLSLFLLALICCVPSFAYSGVTISNDSTVVDTSDINTLYNRILSLDDEIRNNPGAQANNFNPQDSSSLPIGIVKEIGKASGQNFF